CLRDTADRMAAHRKLNRNGLCLYAGEFRKGVQAWRHSIKNRIRQATSNRTGYRGAGVGDGVEFVTLLRSDLRVIRVQRRLGYSIQDGSPMHEKAANAGEKFPHHPMVRPAHQCLLTIRRTTIPTVPAIRDKTAPEPLARNIFTPFA